MSSWIGEQVFVRIAGPNPQSYRGYLVKEDCWSIFLQWVIDEETEAEYLQMRIDTPPSKLCIRPLYSCRREVELIGIIEAY